MFKCCSLFCAQFRYHIIVYDSSYTIHPPNKDVLLLISWHNIPNEHTTPGHKKTHLINAFKNNKKH